MYSLNSFIENNIGKISGIYAIYNILNGKVYIGSSKNIGYRIRKHKETLLKGCHRNYHLQNAFNKYWVNSFECMIVENCNECDLLQREQFWMDLLCAFNDKFGYNIIPKADRHFFSIEHRKNLSLSHIGNTHTKDTKNKIAIASKGRSIDITRKSVYKVDDNGNIIDSFPSILIAADNEKSKSVCIGAACKGIKSIKAYGFFWFYQTDYNKLNFELRLNRKNSERKRAQVKLYKKIKQFDKNHIFIREFNSIKEASELLSINRGSISSCLSGKTKTAGNFIWKLA